MKCKIYVHCTYVLSTCIILVAKKIMEKAGKLDTFKIGRDIYLGAGVMQVLEGRGWDLVKNKSIGRKGEEGFSMDSYIFIKFNKLFI